jgi:hypothetical protein
MLGEVVKGSVIEESLGNGRSGVLFLAGRVGRRLLVERLHDESDWGAFALDAKAALQLSFLPSVTEEVTSAGARVLVAHVDLLPGAKPKKDRKWVYAALLLLLLLLGGWALRGNGEQPEVTPPVEPKTEPLAVQPPAPIDAGVVIAKAEPIDDPDLSPLTEVKPNAEVEAKNPPPLIVKNPKNNIQIEKAPACMFDDRFREYVRRTRSRLLELPGSDSNRFSDADNKLDEALVEKDCHRANDALLTMRRAVGSED